MAEFTQDGRTIGIETPLGKDVLLLLKLDGDEAISNTFSYQLQLASNQMNIPAKDIIGKKVDIWLLSQNGSKRYINGYVKRFAAGAMKADGYRSYRAEIVPWLWFLNKTSDCKIFQNKTAPQVIEEIFSSHSLAEFSLNITRAHRQLDYCVQYRESHLDFISRLCHENGLFYYFSHEQGKHTLTLADKVGAYQNCEEFDVVQTSGGEVFDHISTWDQEFEFISGKWAQTDFNHETPSTSLSASANTIVDLPEANDFEQFAYPGGYGNTEDARSQTDLRMMEEEAGYDIVQASSNYRSFFPGGKFKLEKHDFEHEQGKTFVITHIHVSASDGSYFSGLGSNTLYENSFTAIPDTVQYFPKDKIEKPAVLGPQTAIVVGPDGEKIYTDEQGRVKVQFHWDRHGESNESSSCWLRVSQNWAGKGWGSMGLPHVGHEVIVSFLEGDPDRPIVTGRVYNAENEPAIVSNENKDKNIIRDDYGNEIILDATPGDEHIRLYSPHHQSGFALGKSATSWTDSDSNTFSYGNSYEVGLGTALSGFVGAKLDASVGIFGTLSAALKYDISAGANYTFTTGYTNAWSLNTWINATNASILNQANRDVLTGAGGAISYVANCSEAGGNRSIYYADKDKISLSLGNTYVKEGSNEWYEPYGTPWESIGLVTAALAASATLGGMLHLVVPSDDEAATDDITETEAGGAVALLAVTSVLVGILGGFAVADAMTNNKKSAVKPIKHTDDEEDLKIELKTESGIKVYSKAAPIEITSDDEPVKLSHKNDDHELIYQLEKGKVKLGRADGKSNIIINGQEAGAISGIILIDNSKSTKGSIVLKSKEHIVLNSGNGAKDVKIKSMTFDAGNLKVLGS